MTKIDVANERRLCDQRDAPARVRRRPRVAPSKRALDLAIAVPALTLLAPFGVLIALLVKATSRGPVLFGQERVGLHGESFTMFKFRSMVQNDDDSALREAIRRELEGSCQPGADGSYKLEADPRVTSLGRWLRATSIDELPQLLNVIRGEMSIVGPRPALTWEVEMFPAQYDRRTDVPPGMTGLWQVSGRSHLSTPEMLELDLEYVDNQSFWLDVQIVGRTVPALLRGDGAA